MENTKLLEMVKKELYYYEKFRRRLSKDLLSISNKTLLDEQDKLTRKMYESLRDDEDRINFAIRVFENIKKDLEKEMSKDGA